MDHAELLLQACVERDQRRRSDIDEKVATMVKNIDAEMLLRAQSVRLRTRLMLDYGCDELIGSLPFDDLLDVLVSALDVELSPAERKLLVEEAEALARQRRDEVLSR